MEKNQLTKILQEVYIWNPTLRSKEGELIELIKALSEARPNTRFDKKFAAELKKDLLSHRIMLDDDEGLETNNSLFNFNYMNKKFYFSLGAVVLTGLAVIAILIINKPANKIAFNQRFDFNNEDQLVQSPPGAFGNLAKLSQVSQAEGANEAVRETQSSFAVSSAEGGSLMSVEPATNLSMVVSDGGLTSSSVDVATASNPDLGGDYAKMIWPMQVYEYIYTGETLELAEESSLVYRRIKGDSGFAGKINNLIVGQKIGALNLNSFSNLQSNYISFTENRPFGYSVNIDLKEENIHIGQSWPYWQSERDKCGNDAVCWDSFRLNINDVPSDGSLIAMTDKFLSDKKINYSNYGEPRLDNAWRLNYESAREKNDYYVPEEMSVVYPLVIDNQIVHDQSGNFEGLRVNVNILHKRVSGLSNLSTNRYESSQYSLETDAQKIIKAAELGGSRFYYGDGVEKTTLELGTPNRSLIKYWRFNNGQGEELLVPAMIFPIKNIPENYYGSRSVIIPLVKEMLDETIKNSGGGYGGEIMPMLR